MQRVTKEEAAKAFEVLHQYIEDKNVGSGVYEHMLLNMPISCVFGEANADELSNDIIELMAVQSLAKHFNAPYYLGVNEVVERLKIYALNHLLNNVC